jgi:FemAB-related protein (PEP-CTERM system-associated)
VSIRLFQPADRERWDRFVWRAPGAHAYHLAGWSTVIEKGCGQQAVYLLSEDESGEIEGVLPLARVRSRLFGDFFVSLPYFNYGGPCAVDRRVDARLVEQAVRMARDAGSDYLELRLTRPDGFGLAVKSSKTSMRLQLPDDPSALWTSFPAKLRSQINRPIKAGMKSRVGGVEDLDAFYRVFSVNMRDLGTPVYGRRFFEAILRQFAGSARVCVVHHEQRPVAAAIVLAFRGSMEIPWASSIRGMNRLAPNMLLYWTVLKEACRSGCREFDFGRSSPDSGPYRFKAQWGASPVPIYWHYWVPEGEELPNLNPANPRYRRVIGLWRRLPVGLTQLIGPAIVSKIP